MYVSMSFVCVCMYIYVSYVFQYRVLLKYIEHSMVLWVYMIKCEIALTRYI